MRRVIGFLSTFMALIFTLCRVQGQIYTGCDHDEVLKSHPVFCNQFLQCSNGYLYEMKCDVDLVFNEKMQYCDWEHNVDRCSGLDTTTPTETTTPEDLTTPEEEEATTTVEETTTQEEETTTLEEDTTTQEEETTTQENCEWYQYDFESENYIFDSCTEATEEDLTYMININECHRVAEENDILKPGGKFQLENFSDGQKNCFGFHQCIKFCESMVHKCTFRCAPCMDNEEESTMKRGIFDKTVNGTNCFASYHQDCYDDDIKQDTCSVTKTRF